MLIFHILILCAVTAGQKLGEGLVSLNKAPKIPLEWGKVKRKMSITALASAGDKGACEELMTWIILYCGGSGAVVDILEEIHKNSKIALKVESFNW